MTKLERLLVQHEGLRNKPYRCPAGKLTIGVGRNLEARGISDDEALYMLRNDIVETSRRVNRELPWVLGIGRVRREVLINMAFNLGLAGLLTFKRMLAAAKVSDWDTASIEMMESNWSGQVGDRATELAVMMATGEWPTRIGGA